MCDPLEMNAGVARSDSDVPSSCQATAARDADAVTGLRLNHILRHTFSGAINSWQSAVRPIAWSRPSMAEGPGSYLKMGSDIIST